MKLKQFLKTAFVFLIGNMLSKLVSFFLLPLYTSKIDPSQFGNYDVAISFINLIVPIAFFQIWDGMYRFAFEYEDIKDKQVVISNAFVVYGIGVFIYFVFFFLLHAFISFEYFIYVLMYGVTFALHYMHTYVARVYLCNKLFVWSGTASTLITALFNIILILGCGWDIKSIYFSMIIGNIFQIVIIETKIGVFRRIKFKLIDKNLIEKMLRFSIPLCIATVSYWLLSGLTKIYIQNIVGDYANGLYAVANKFATLITLFVSVIQFAWNESAYIMTEDDQEKKYSNYSMCINIMTLGVVYVTGVVCVAVKVIFPYLIDSQYNSALALIPATLVGVAANALAGFSATVFMAEKKNSLITISTFIASVVNIIAGYTCSKVFGLHGAVICLSACFVLLCVIRIGWLILAYRIKLDFFSLVIGCIILFTCIIAFFVTDSIWILFVVALLSIIFTLVAFRKYVVFLVKPRNHS